MLPKMIATDLDGTLLDPQGNYDRTRFDRLVGALWAQGSRLVITTGDPLDHVQELFGELPRAKRLTYVVEDGALIVDGRGTVLRQLTLPSRDWHQAVRWIQTAVVMANHYLIACGVDRAYTTLAADSDRFAASRAFYPSLTHVDDLLTVTAPILKLDVTWLAADVTPQVTAFNQIFSGLHATSSGLGGLNVSLPEVSKGRALAFLGDRWGIAPAEMAAFGDSGNDLAMLEYVGQGIAVANAAPEVLAAVTTHTATTNAQPAVLNQLAAWVGLTD